MAKREVSADEVIGVWLRREFERNWQFIQEVARYRVPSLTKVQIKDQMVDNPNYQNILHNWLRFLFLFQFRVPLLRPLCIANWFEEILNEDEFRELCVIAQDPSWVFLSKSTGRLSAVSETVLTETGLARHPNRYIRGLVREISDIEKSGCFDRNLILLRSKDSEFTTILEGNKTAVALYIKHYLKKEFSYEPFRVLVGYMDTRSHWQW